VFGLFGVVIQHVMIRAFTGGGSIERHMTDTQTPGRKYEIEDIESLGERARKVLLTVAQQSGYSKPDNTDVDDVGKLDTATTSTIKEKLGLGNNPVNYELNKLEGGYGFSVSVPLVETHQQGTDDRGRMKAKRVVLTDAGKQAIDDGVVEQTQIETGPDWFPSNEDTDAQLEALANRLHAHETALDEITQHLGYRRLSTVATAGDDQDSMISDDALAEFSTESALELLAAMAQGQKDIRKALKRDGVDI
jgi:hypothetical protein